MFEAVIWDFGGVITTSPFDAFNRHEAERGLPKDLIRMINATNPDSNAWALFERSEIDAAAFDEMFSKEAEAKGHTLRGRDVLGLLSGDVQPEMVEALRRCKEAGLRIACITNNVKTGDGAGMALGADRANQMAEALALFEHVFESAKLGIRKPDPRIYLMACEALGVSPERAVYLDDLGINLKPARELGMRTIKVLNATQALSDLEAALGIPLR